MKYIIPDTLLDALNEINNSVQRFAIASNGVIEIPNGWAEHLQFVAANNLLPSYESQVIDDKGFCAKLQIKLLSAFKTMGTLDPLVYRQMTDAFKYAKDAADNGNPTQVKYELQQLSDALPLPNWATIKQDLIAEIDNYILQNP